LSLSVRSLSKSFPAPGRDLIVLRDVNLQLERGQSAAIVGPSGSGKSTLLHILGTLDTPSSGSLSLEGVNPLVLSEPQLADFRNRQIGFVFQEHYLLPQCTVLENVVIPTLVAERDDKVMEVAHGLIDRVGLGARIDHRPAELSGGERQRVAVARALIRKPALLLADEPTGNLDRRAADAVGELLLDLARQEQAILVVVTHSATLAGRLPEVLELVDGSLQRANGLC
jgi:lipoprotein-releasing system ATP-binding protein